MAADELRERFVLSVEELNRLSEQRGGMTGGVFGPVSLTLTRLTPSELGFLRVVPFFFSHYYEVGRDSLPFLVEKFAAYGLDGDGKLQDHYTIVEKLRTYLYHNLNPLKDRDERIRAECKDWFKQTCGTVDPTDEANWQACLEVIMGGAVDFIATLISVVERIVADEASQEILRDWVVRIERYHPPEAFDRIIGIAAADLGREHLDIVRFRNRYYDRWRAELAALKPGYDFDRGARRLVETALLEVGISVLPIAGSDIISVLSIEPGPRVGELLRMARDLYQAAPCSKDELLARLGEVAGQ